MRAHVVWLVLLTACGAPRHRATCEGEGCFLDEDAVFCVLDDECPAGEWCAGGVCEPGNRENPDQTCTTHNDCSIGRFCNILRGVCVDCLNDDHCDVGTICRSDGTCGADAIVDCSAHAHSEGDECVCDDGYVPQGDSCVPMDLDPPDPPTGTPNGSTVPDDWTCDPNLYHQGDWSNQCDCGCGVFDPDCWGSEVGNCGRKHCGEDERVVRGDNALCEPIPPSPADWSCEASWYLDGECDCGCGADDGDCPDGYTASACGYDACPGLQEPLADDPAHCGGWTCDESLFDEAWLMERCHCGCGTIDGEDCGYDARASACDVNMCPDGQVPAENDNAICVEL